jgi:hypothetical protein
MSKEALKLALSCIKSSAEYKRGNATFVETAEDIEQALAAPVQPAPAQYAALEQALTRLQKRYGELESKVATQRPWVGLAAADKHKPDMGAYVYLNDDWLDGYKTGMEYAEAKLKELNA